MSDDLLSELIDSNNQLTRLEEQVREKREQRNELIKQLRNQKITARKLSDVLGISEQSVHKIVKGER